MNLIENLLQSVADLDCEIRRVCIGLHWTVVESRHVGIAHTYKTDKKVEVAGSGQLTGGSALELAARLRSWEPLEASLGLATLNSLVYPSGRPGNVLEEVVQRAPGTTITVIGRFPANDRIAANAGTSYFLEMQPEGDELPSTAAEEVLPKSDINVITATALINKTLPRLLELGQGTTTIVLGPSTPMNDVLIEHGATILAGTRVLDPDALIDSVMQGVKSFRRLAGIEPLVCGQWKSANS